MIDLEKYKPLNTIERIDLLINDMVDNNDSKKPTSNSNNKKPVTNSGNYLIPFIIAITCAAVIIAGAIIILIIKKRRKDTKNV